MEIFPLRQEPGRKHLYKGMLRKKLDIDVVSISEPVLDGMYGRLIEMIIEWQDEFYSYNLAGT